jgi:hypothetical protein
MTRLSNHGRWAVRYVEVFGWHIFPLRPRTKEPFGGLGVYNATNDIDQIADWWRWQPNANIGWHPGADGCLALDADSYKHTYGGADLLSPADQETVTSLTGSGGTHLTYRLPEGVRVGNATGRLPAGIDIRGWGGYIVLPPSIHPNGRRYQWETRYGPHEIPIAPLPAVIWDKIHMFAMSGKIESTHPARIRQAVALVDRVLVALDIPAVGPVAYGQGGRRWALGSCPFMPADDPHPNDRGPFVAVFPDGRIVAGCQHNRCRQAIARSGLSGWRWLRRRAGLGAGAWHDAAIDALVASLEELAR